MARRNSQSQGQTKRSPETIRMPLPHLSAVAVEKAYTKGPLRIPVLCGVDFSVNRGEFVSIIGQSGSGKSTLMHLLGLLDSPDSGEVQLSGERVDDLPVSARDKLRNRTFGFIFQFYHLLPELSVLENVLMPLMIQHTTWNFFKRSREFRDAASAILHEVGLGHRLTHKPSELSGGEMQRAAIARALITQPEVLLADEPTGNLDADTGAEIMSLLKRLNTQNQLTIIMVTHDESVAKQAHRIVRLKGGQMVGLAEVA